MPRQARLEPAGPGGEGEENIMSGGGAEVGIHGASAARFLEMTTSSVSRMARLKEMTGRSLRGRTKTNN